MDDFRKYATKHLGMNSLVLDDVIKSQAGYLNPYILEERQLNVTQLDVFSRLMMDRIIFLGVQVDDASADDIIAQLGNQNNFYRLRLGIGHPGHSSMVANFVLSRAPRSEQDLLDTSIDNALAVLPDILAGNWSKAMHTLHSQKA